MYVFTCLPISGVFDDMSNIIKNINPDSYLRHPLKCLQGERDEGDGAFGGGCTVFEDFVSHILTKFQLTNALRQANSSLVFCEPHFMTTRQRRKLAKFFFETTGTGRSVCRKLNPMNVLVIGLDFQMRFIISIVT